MALFNTSGTISASETTATGVAVEYDADSIELTIAATVFVTSLDDHAVESARFGSSLINNGIVVAPDGFMSGVVFTGDSGSILNNAEGAIIAWDAGVVANGADTTVTNHGIIRCEASFGVIMNGNDVELHNTGEIVGFLSGFASGGDNTLVENTGTIRGEQTGISVAGNNTFITNFDLIRGADFGISSFSSGQVKLDNRATVDGLIDLNAANQNDVITNRGEIIGDVMLGSGDDKYKAAGDGTAGDVFGEDGDDDLLGGKASETFNGGAGSDFLRGKQGRDILTGGADDDTFYFKSIKDSVKGSQRDKIQDMERGVDEIDVSKIDAQKGTSGNQTFDWIGDQGFSDTNGELRYKDKGDTVIVQGDVNGDGKADFEIYVNVGALDENDFVL